MHLLFDDDRRQVPPDRLSRLPHELLLGLHRVLHPAVQVAAEPSPGHRVGVRGLGAESPEALPGRLEPGAREGVWSTGLESGADVVRVGCGMVVMVVLVGMVMVVVVVEAVVLEAVILEALVVEAVVVDRDEHWHDRWDQSRTPSSKQYVLMTWLQIPPGEGLNIALATTLVLSS